MARRVPTMPEVGHRNNGAAVHAEPGTNGTAIVTEARRLHDLGYPLTPTRGKKPYRRGWQMEHLTREELEHAYHDGATGIALILNQSDYIDVECDTGEAKQNLQRHFGGTIPPTPTWQ